MRGLVIMCFAAFARGHSCAGEMCEPDRVILLQEKTSQLLSTKDRILAGANDTDTADANTSADPLFNIVDVQKVEDEFRGGEQPVLVAGETVEMAFFDGYRDWLIFTNWRLLEVDGQTSALTGSGASAESNKVTYSSKLWHLFHSWKVETADRRGQDVRLELLPLNLEFEFMKQIGEEKLFEIGNYIGEKIKSSRPNRNQVLKHAQEASSWFEGGLPILDRCRESAKTLEGIVGKAASMIGQDETVLYKFSETEGVNPDDMIVTDKHILMVESEGKETEYDVYPFPTWFSFDAWTYIGSWKITTAGRKGGDRDSEGEATAYFGFAPRPYQGSYHSKTISFSFDKRHVDTAKLFEYHSKLQEKVTKAWNFTGN